MKSGSHVSYSCRCAKRGVRRYTRWQQNREFSKLRTIVPAVAEQEKVSKVEIVEEAVKYIDVLHERFMKRFGNSEDMEHIKRVILTLMAQKSAEDNMDAQTQYSLPVKTTAPSDALPDDKRAQ